MSSKAPSVMLVDDHTMLRQGLRRSLETEGIPVVAEASNGEEAVRVALDTKPSVVLMDVSMPQIDGIEATRRLMAADARQRVVILTMHIDREVFDSALKVGAVGYVTKDSSISEVISPMRRLDSLMRFTASMVAEATNSSSPRSGNHCWITSRLPGFGSTRISTKPHACRIDSISDFNAAPVMQQV